MDDPREWSEERLAGALRTGSAEAQAEAHRRYRPGLLRFCSSYLGDESGAEDVVQETLGKLAGGGAAFEGAARPWLYKVARNRCLDILRRQKRSPTRNRPLRTGFDVAAGVTGAGTRLAKEERRRLIRQIIEEMPEDYREVLHLKYFEDFSRVEMATALGLSEAAVKGRLVRASEYLHEQLRKFTWAQG